MLILLTPKESKDNKTEPNNALKNPSTSNPGAIHPANINISALITKLNKPNVKKLIGKVIICKNGLINVLISAITIQTNIALIKFSTVIPGTIQETMTIKKAYTNQIKILLTIFFSFFIKIDEKLTF